MLHLSSSPNNMFSATQSITPLSDYTSTLTIQKVKRPRCIEATPACWSQNLIADLEPQRFIELTQSYYQYKDYRLENSTTNNGTTVLNFHHRSDDNNTLFVAATHAQSIDIALVKSFCEESEKVGPSTAVFITQGVFSSGALDFCARKPVTLISNRELLSMILKLDTTQQSVLLTQATST